MSYPVRVEGLGKYEEKIYLYFSHECLLKILTQVTDSISYNNNRNTKHAFHINESARMDRHVNI